MSEHKIIRCGDTWMYCDVDCANCKHRPCLTTSNALDWLSDQFHELNKTYRLILDKIQNNGG